MTTGKVGSYEGREPNIANFAFIFLKIEFVKNEGVNAYSQSKHL